VAEAPYKKASFRPYGGGNRCRIDAPNRGAPYKKKFGALLKKIAPLIKHPSAATDTKVLAG